MWPFTKTSPRPNRDCVPSTPPPQRTSKRNTSETPEGDFGKYQPHPDEVPFLLAIREAHFRDSAPRLIYADWLEENGEERKAHFIRECYRLEPIIERWEKCTDRCWLVATIGMWCAIIQFLLLYLPLKKAFPKGWSSLFAWLEVAV